MMNDQLKNCPGTLAEGHTTYSRTALNRVFAGRKVSHIFPYVAPNSDEETDQLFIDNRKRLSISGVQEKFSVMLEKNKLRLINEGEQGQYILKPIPAAGKHADQMPANEHLTMQIARQAFGIETAENAMVFFKDGSPAYITKRFDTLESGDKWGQEDFASLAGATPYTHGEDYKYMGSYLDLFHLMKKYVPAYPIEAPKLFRLILFNYLISNGDAHLKNFSLIQTPMGDYRLSPAYDLLNSRIHIDDREFALQHGLLAPRYAKGKIKDQFIRLGQMADITDRQLDKALSDITSNKMKVLDLIHRSYLSDRFKRSYRQAYLGRLKKLER